MIDFGRLAALHSSAISMPRPWSADEIAGLLTSPGCFLIDDPQGFALGRAVADEAELLTIVTAPEARRQGIARRLLAGFEAEAKARNAAIAFLEVAANNDAAIALYTAALYGQTGLRRGYYRSHEGLPVDALLFAKAL